MNVNKLTMRITDPFLDMKNKQALYEKTTKILPLLTAYWTCFTVLNTIKLI
jgi:hypothetical protein